MSGRKLLVALLLLAAAALASWRLHRPAATAGALRLARVPAAVAGWRGRDLEVTPRQQELLETRDVLLRDYRDGGDAVLACVAVAGPSNKAAHPPEICYRGQGWTIEAQTAWDVALAGRSIPLSELLIAQAGERHLVWSWYHVGGDETESWWREQWLALRARLAGDDVPAALLRFSTPIATAVAGPIAMPGAGPIADDELRAARSRLARFLGSFLPIVDAALAEAAGAGEAAPEKARAK